MTIDYGTSNSDMWVTLSSDFDCGAYSDYVYSVSPASVSSIVTVDNSAGDNTPIVNLVSTSESDTALSGTSVSITATSGTFSSYTKSVSFVLNIVDPCESNTLTLDTDHGSSNF